VHLHQLSDLLYVRVSAIGLYRQWVTFTTLLSRHSRWLRLSNDLKQGSRVAQTATRRSYLRSLHSHLQSRFPLFTRPVCPLVAYRAHGPEQSSHPCSNVEMLLMLTTIPAYLSHYSVACKIIERLNISTDMPHYLRKRRHGFLSGRSTNTNLLKTLNDLTLAITINNSLL